MVSQKLSSGNKTTQQKHIRFDLNTVDFPTAPQMDIFKQATLPNPLELVLLKMIFLVFQGFPKIEEDVLNREGFLIMPPIRRQNRQFNPAQRLTQLKIAIQRIHVERAIGKSKFKIKILPSN